MTQLKLTRYDHRIVELAPPNLMPCQPRPVVIEKVHPSVSSHPLPMEGALDTSSHFSILSEDKLRLVSELARQDLARMKERQERIREEEGDCATYMVAKETHKKVKLKPRPVPAPQFEMAAMNESRAKEEVMRLQHQMAIALETLQEKCESGAVQMEDESLLEEAERRKRQERMYQQRIRSARTMYSLQQDLREAQALADRHKTLPALLKLCQIQKAILKTFNEVNSNQFLAKLKSVYSEVSHLLRQMQFLCTQLNIEWNTKLKPEILDWLASDVNSKPVEKTERPDPVVKRAQSPPELQRE